MRYAINSTKIHNELEWLPETKFEDGIKKTIKKQGMMGDDHLR